MELPTNDLLLKTVTHDDIYEVARMWEFEKGSIPLPEAQKAIEYMQNNHMQNRTVYIYHLCLAIYEKGSNSIIGWCGLDGKPVPDNPERMEIYYLIDSAYRNKGYATQCASALLEHAFEVAKIEENGDPKFFLDSYVYQKTKAMRLKS